MTISTSFYVAEQHDIEDKTILCGASFFQFSLIYLFFFLKKVIIIQVKKVSSTGQHYKKYHVSKNTF